MRPTAHFVLALVLLLLPPGRPEDIISVNTVKAWSDKIGFELLQLGKYVTNVDKFQENYKEVEIKILDGKSLVKTIADKIEIMMSSKVDAIQRIMDVAESSAQAASSRGDPDDKYEYKSAKNYSHITTNYSEHFGGDVNLDYSAVHVPTTVFGRAKPVLKAIRWSEELDNIFKSNYALDPSLSWQYFGSATGFMRQFPAIHWKLNGSDPHDPDLFDCRTRSWYIEAATSPKDVLILVDVSGSMTGMRKEIAKHVVNNILDTLGNNDYVNIVKFSNVTKLVVPCFGDTLVQANLANIRELKNGISEMNTEQIANFSMILTYAFQTLARFKYEDRGGANCNQAIMLITDGVPENYKEIFQQYNWENTENPDAADMPVRLFTYLIGKEVADVTDSRWMACANRGYFVHLSTLAEVREQVLHYISVMARPLVLNLTIHPTIWTPVYADIADPKITDWLWDKKERYDQKERYWIYRRNKQLRDLGTELEDYVKKSRKHPHLENEMYKYRLMTSVSMPVYDRMENANITEQVLVKNAYWVTQTRETRIANLLGVAGTDIPVDDIKQRMLPHVLGVHGYAFIVTNNGYILTHPDLRPVFQGILKPAYNSVDMVEVELIQGDVEPRRFNEILMKLRRDIVNGSIFHSDAHMYTKYHYDNLKRVSKLKRRYDSARIEGTPFTVVVSLPLWTSDVTYRVHAPKDVRRLNFDGIRAETYFAGKNWRVHPDWLYCKLQHQSEHKSPARKKHLKHSINKYYKTSQRNPYHFENSYNFASPEEELRHFLKKVNEPLWKWGALPSEHATQNTKKAEESTDARYCDRDLVMNLVFDAMVTEWFADPSTSRNENAPLARLMKLLSRAEFHQRFGYTLAFVATRSGLTRWQDFLINDTKSPSEPPEHHFSRLYPRAVDEVWYKRAVEQYYLQPESFVFSVPIDDDGGGDNTLVTASRAIFVGNESMKAPAAVVGFQMTLTALQDLFKKITGSCNGKQCKRTCLDADVDCYLVDNHGYIVAGSSNKSVAGRFLGDVNGILMHKLIETEVFENITIFDYQAVCFRDLDGSNDANMLLTPFKMFAMAMSWLYGQLALNLARIGFWDYGYAEAVSGSNLDNDGDMELQQYVTLADESPHEDLNDQNSKPAAEIKDDGIYDHFVRIKRTRPEPCDQKVSLYLLRNVTLLNAEYDNASMGIVGCDHLRYTVQQVNFTNMVLLVVDKRGCHSTLKMSTEPEELEYTANNSLACRKKADELPRLRPPTCIRSHPRESEIKESCGRAPSSALLDLRLLVGTIVVCLLGLRH